MARYRKKKIDATANPSDIWNRIKNAVIVAGCAEVRADDSGDLFLITWLDEHVDWSQHQEVP